MTIGNHSCILIFHDKEAATIPLEEKILTALNDFELANSSTLDITNWRIEGFRDSPCYIFIDHKKRKACSRKQNH